ncbi:MAG: DUF427 domain-containing protein [Balneolaceae bacterium]
MMTKISPGPGQESVWDYPRPPKLEDTQSLVRVVFNGTEIARSTRTKRVLETSHPPVYYIPPEDVRMECLQKISGTTYCEWKGKAHYYDVIVGDRIAEKAAWYYPEPKDRFSDIANYVAFYAHKMDACFVDEEKVRGQYGGFYGGWITSKVVGPFKGQPGSVGW